MKNEQGSTSPSKLAANRSNALKSTGPRTLEGKQSAALNAVRHGLLSAAPVVGHETVEAWTEHYRATIEACCPVGYLEALLAERVAALLWRLGRIVQYETCAMVAPVDYADPGTNDSLADMRRKLVVLTGEDERQRRVRFLFGKAQVDQIIRYETHLERSLVRTLRELQRAQEIRTGRSRAPLAVDVTIGPRRVGDAIDTVGFVSQSETPKPAEG